MSGDRLREALEEIAALYNNDNIRPASFAIRAGQIAVEALAADERGGGEGLDVERLAMALHVYSGHTDRHDDFRGCAACSPKAVTLAREYAAAQPAPHAAEGERKGLPLDYETGYANGESSVEADFLIALTEAGLFPDDGRPFGPTALVEWLTRSVERRPRTIAEQEAMQQADWDTDWRRRHPDG